MAGKFEGLLEDASGKRIAIPGIWAISPGNVAPASSDPAAVPAAQLYFTQQVTLSGGASGGLFGYLKADLPTWSKETINKFVYLPLPVCPADRKGLFHCHGSGENVSALLAIRTSGSQCGELTHSHANPCTVPRSYAGFGFEADFIPG
jgi:hypothetical protein